MSWGFIFSESIAALKFHKGRTFFTTTSLAWGVACFVILISYGAGFKGALVKAFNAVGQNLVISFGGQTSTQEGGLRAGRKIRLELADAAIVKEAVPLVQALSPEIMKYGVKINSGHRDKDITLRAVYPEYEVVRNMKLARGAVDQRGRPAAPGAGVRSWGRRSRRICSAKRRRWIRR